MSAYDFDYLVFIGRFQPFHNGHKAVVESALSQAQTVILLCGSADTPRTLRNPWFVEEREQMIRSVFEPQDNARMAIMPLHDVPYSDDAWIGNVQRAVQKVIDKDGCAPAKIGLIGHLKDNSSYYLNLFPQWASVSVDNVAGINATAIRRRFFRLDAGQAFNAEHLPSSVFAWLNAFRDSAAYQEVHDEQCYIDNYKRQWADAPYEPIFVTTDAVVVQSGHVLLVERKHRPGKGRWALPGGFLDPEERLFDGCVRELTEETALAIDQAMLRGSLRRQKVYDAPNRSARGRTITHVFYFELQASSSLAQVSAADDAAEAFWQPLGNLPRQRFFEDHFDIIQDITGARR